MPKSSDSTSKIILKNSGELLKVMEDFGAEYLDFNFTDLRGQLQHTAQHVGTVTKETVEDGIYFDGSSIAGWKGIQESDMNLVPDLDKIVASPFAAQTTLKVFCDVLEPKDGKPYTRDPRSTAKAAEKYLKSTGVADTAYFGPEAEFFVFEDVRFETTSHRVSHEVYTPESGVNNGREDPHGNLAHRPGVKGGYFPDAPLDTLSDLRAEMVSVLHNMGVPMEKHHHEVAPGQCELGMKYSSLVDCADNMQLYKHVVKNVAHAYGKSATFMPKPVYNDNGSGMHCHQSLFKGGKNIFAGTEYGNLSDTALFYIGGIIKHAKALNAFTNPTTNSYKRLVPGFEAPVILTYSERNRSAACRIPALKDDNGRRIEIRFPDATANPYLAFSAMLMAGLDGIENKIHPGDPANKDLFALTKEETSEYPTTCGSLREALDALEKDHEFLLKGNVFSTDLIEGYVALKEEELERFVGLPHPVEFDLYYSS